MWNIHYNFQVLAWIYCGFLQQGLLGDPLLYWKVTVYDHVLTWNDAKLHCESMGQTLLTLDGPDKMDILQTLYSTQLSYDWINSDIWIGLHNVDTSGISGNERFYWHRNCADLTSGTWTNWDSIGSEPDRPDAQRCIRIFNGGHWRTVECSSMRGYACEDIAGACQFEESYEGLVVLPSDVQTLNISTDRDSCVDICNYVSMDGLDCWVVEVPHFSDTQCTLYFMSDPLYMDKGENTGSKAADTYIRRCVGVNFDGVTVVANTMLDVFPASTCPLHDQDPYVRDFALTCWTQTSGNNTSNQTITSYEESGATSTTLDRSTEQSSTTTQSIAERNTTQYVLDENELNIKIERMTNALKVDKTQTSSDIRKRISVYESRTGAVSMGLVGCIVIACVLLCPVLSDSIIFVRYIKGRSILVSR